MSFSSLTRAADALVLVAQRHRGIAVTLSIAALWALAKGGVSLVLLLRRTARAEADPKDTLKPHEAARAHAESATLPPASTPERATVLHPHDLLRLRKAIGQSHSLLQLDKLDAGARSPGVSSPLARADEGGALSPGLGLTLDGGVDATAPPPDALEIARLLNLFSHLGGALSLTHILALHERMVHRTLDAGEVLFAAGDDSSDGLFIIERGSVGIFSGSDAAARGGASAEPLLFASSSSSSSSSTLAMDERYAGASGERLCTFGVGTTLGENTLFAGILPCRELSRNVTLPSQWRPTRDTARTVTARALERTRVLQLTAPVFLWFADTFPEAITSLVLDATVRQWRVADTLLGGCLRLADAWLLAIELPGSAPSFCFDDPEPGSSASTHYSSDFAPPVSMSRDLLCRAADRVLTFQGGEVMYSQGHPGNVCFVLLSGFAFAHVDRAPPLLSGGVRMGGIAAGGVAAAARVPGGHFTGAGIPAGGLEPIAPRNFPIGELQQWKHHHAHGSIVVRAIGAGSVAGAHACITQEAYRETLTALGTTVVAVFSYASFTRMSRGMALGATSGSIGSGSSSGASQQATSPVAFPITPQPRRATEMRGTPEAIAFDPSGLGSPRPPPWPVSPDSQPCSIFVSPATDNDDSSHRNVLLHVCLAIARSLVPLPRLLLSLGLHRVWYRSGDSLFRRGDPADGLDYVVSGRVRCITTALNRVSGLLPQFGELQPQQSVTTSNAVDNVTPILYLDVGSGETVGELSVLAREAVRTSTAIAARDVEVVHISSAAFSLLATRYPTVNAHFTVLLARRFQELTRQVMTLSSGTTSPGLVGVEARIGIPYSLPAPPAPTLSLGALHDIDDDADGGSGGNKKGNRRRRRLGALSPVAHSTGVIVMPPVARAATASAAWASGDAGLVPRSPSALVYHTIAVVPAGTRSVTHASLTAFCSRLARSLATLESSPVQILSSSALDAAHGTGVAATLNFAFVRDRASAWLGAQEEAFRFLILQGDASSDSAVASTWTGLCVAHADIVLLLADGSGDAGLSLEEKELVYFTAHCGASSAPSSPRDVAASRPAGPVHAPAAALWRRALSRLNLSPGSGNAAATATTVQAASAAPPPLTLARKDLVLLHAPGVQPTGTRAWLRARRVSWHHHCSSSFDSSDGSIDVDVDRLARFLCGRAVGVVLGGGGARGLAHLGLLRQLEARGVPVDVIGGASQGSFMAAAWALTQTSSGTDSIAARLSAGIASMWNFMTSLTLPFVSWTSGAHFDDVIRDSLGGVQIEDLRVRYFCVSLNATDGAIAVHSTGPLWRYVRASMSVLRLLPPVFDRDTHRLLVDGGYASNLPVDVLHAFVPGAVGLTIACDVECKDSNRTWLDITAADFGPSSDDLQLSGFYVLWRLIRARFGGRPFSVPWMDDLFLQVSYLRHYSSLRSLLSDATHDSAMEEPLAPDSVFHESGGGDARREGGGGWSAKPCLLYVRPPVGRFGLLAYGQMDTIADLGAAAAAATVERWQRLRWAPPQV